MRSFGAITFIIIVLILTMLYCLNSKAELKYLMADDVTGQIYFDGVSTNTSNPDLFTTNVFQGLNFDNTNVVDQFSQVVGDQLQGYALTRDSVNQLTMGAGITINADKDKLIERTNDVTITFGNIDAGSEAASTWYGVYAVLSNETVVGVLSTNMMGPVGYDDFRRVGIVYNDASSDLLDFKQVGTFNERTYIYRGVKADFQALNGGSATIETAIDLGVWVPPTAESAQLAVEFRVDNGGAANKGYLRTDPADLEQEFSTGQKSSFFARYTTIVFFGADDNEEVDYRVDDSRNDMSIFVLAYTEEL